MTEVIWSRRIKNLATEYKDKAAKLRVGMGDLDELGKVRRQAVIETLLAAARDMEFAIIDRKGMR